jgi:hypothetical protein
MSWKQLLAQRKVQLHTTSKQELDGLRALIERDLTDAALSGLSADRRFATAYNAALQTAKMVIACAGYRVASTPGGSVATLQECFDKLADMLLAPSVAGLFKWRQFEPEMILLAVGWYLRFSLSYRDVEELLAERGLHVDHVTELWENRRAHSCLTKPMMT